jgi:hypothetical protein
VIFLLIKKYTLAVICLFTFLAVFTGCGSSKKNMNYIKTPDQIILNANTNQSEIEKIQDSIRSMKNSNSDTKKLQDLKDKLFVLLNSSAIEINDKEFINKFISILKSYKGTLSNTLDKESQDLFNEHSYYDIQFAYNDLQNQTIEGINKGYLPNFIILNNGTALIPYMPASSKLSSKGKNIIINLSKDDMKFIKDYYDSHKSAK